MTIQCTVYMYLNIYSFTVQWVQWYIQYIHYKVILIIVCGEKWNFINPFFIFTFPFYSNCLPIKKVVSFMFVIKMKGRLTKKEYTKGEL